MTKDEFIKNTERVLKANGFSKIKIQPALFGKSAKISARDSSGQKCELKAYIKSSWGKEKLVIEPEDDLAWIDELEMLDIIFDDE